MRWGCSRVVFAAEVNSSRVYSRQHWFGGVLLHRLYPTSASHAGCRQPSVLQLVPQLPGLGPCMSGRHQAVPNSPPRFSGPVMMVRLPPARPGLRCGWHGGSCGSRRAHPCGEALLPTSGRLAMHGLMNVVLPISSTLIRFFQRLLPLSTWGS